MSSNQYQNTQATEATQKTNLKEKRDKQGNITIDLGSDADRTDSASEMTEDEEDDVVFVGYRASSQEEKPQEQKDDGTKGIPQYKICEICYKELSLSNNSHEQKHKKSLFVTNLTKMFYEKSKDPYLILCKKCKEEKPSSATFKRNQYLTHLCEHHLLEFKGNEKELLKQKDFFSMINRNKDNSVEIVDSFKFTYDELCDFVKYMNKKCDKDQKRLFKGKLYYRLKTLLISKGERPPIKAKIQGLIDYFIQKNFRIEEIDCEKENEVPYKEGFDEILKKKKLDNSEEIEIHSKFKDLPESEQLKRYKGAVGELSMENKTLITNLYNLEMLILNSHSDQKQMDDLVEKLRKKHGK